MLRKLVARFRPPLARLKPYVSVCNDAMSQDELENNVNVPMRAFTESGGISDLDAYVALMGFLAERHDRFAVVPAERFLDHCDSDRVTVFLRHDVDVDLTGAVKMSRVEGGFGFRSSYFILHSECAYYGRLLPDGVFERYGAADGHIRALAANGQDVGLHIDPLGLIGRAGVDGIQGMLHELRRIRSLGVDVDSVCSHNSNTVYNAMNQDVFAGRNMGWQDHVLVRGERVPLGRVDAAEHGIAHFCDFLLTTATRPADPTVSAYGFTIDRHPTFRIQYDISFSIVMGRRWELAGSRRFLNNASSIDYDDLFPALLQVPRGSKIVLNIHPMYYGHRY
ncbi:hypothetical protein [Bosea sp. (in: a-proteobacteria)]|uniref:hypothetical protein n=1 Tax=Bosea sp. (in: a-proteobacteria) TaxID=1871050 RepID=UPI0026165490|nr:hypothetical protein [Bosea sp. (in: a-proteobacteria)]MCO5090674.1 hypothetical protein [Bosea sp. (in: a-proteobacteria)]